MHYMVDSQKYHQRSYALIIHPLIDWRGARLTQSISDRINIQAEEKKMILRNHRKETSHAYFRRNQRARPSGLN